MGLARVEFSVSGDYRIRGDTPRRAVRNMQESLFSEMSKVRVTDPKQIPMEGYVIESRFLDGRWLYKVSLPDPGSRGGTFDNWYDETALSPAT